MQAVFIDIRINRNSRNIQLTTRSDDSHRYFPSIRNQNTLNHTSSNNGVLKPTASPSSTNTPLISPSSVAFISFMTFIASKIHNTSPFLKRVPALTNGSLSGLGLE